MTVAVAFQPIAKSAILESKRRGGSPQGFEERAQTWLDLSTAWDDAKDDAAAIAASKAFYEGVAALQKKHGVKPIDFLYLNDAADYQKVFESYGAENVRFLKAVSRKYDPKSVFQKLVKGGFKLPK